MDIRNSGERESERVMGGRERREGGRERTDGITFLEIVLQIRKLSRLPPLS